MTDLEITKLCAEAMGITLHDDRWKGERFYLNPVIDGKEHNTAYDPLHDDAQAMALVKKMKLRIEVGTLSKERWLVSAGRSTVAEMARTLSDSLDLNRAICECVAKMTRLDAAPNKDKEGK